MLFLELKLSWVDNGYESGQIVNISKGIQSVLYVADEEKLGLFRDFGFESFSQGLLDFSGPFVIFIIIKMSGHSNAFGETMYLQNRQEFESLHFEA